jgi:hypothetical protein
MSSANRDILTVSLPICIPFFPSSCLIALGHYSTLNKSINASQGKGPPCFPPKRPVTT